MASMGKEDVIWLFIEPLPPDLLTLFMNLSDFFFFGVLSDRIFVALEADRNGWHPGKILGFKVAMAGVAL